MLVGVTVRFPLLVSLFVSSLLLPLSPPPGDWEEWTCGNVGGWVLRNTTGVKYSGFQPLLWLPLLFLLWLPLYFFLVSRGGISFPFPSCTGGDRWVGVSVIPSIIPLTVLSVNTSLFFVLSLHLGLQYWVFPFCCCVSSFPFLLLSSFHSLCFLFLCALFCAGLVFFFLRGRLFSPLLAFPQELALRPVRRV